MEEEDRCQYCGEPIDNEALINEDLYKIFGYVYCSRECYEAHLAEK